MLGNVTPHAAAALLDTLPEEEFDNFTVLAARLLSAPIALLSVIDFDGDRQYFKSQFGLPKPWSDARQAPLSYSFCRLVVEDDQPLCIQNSRDDIRAQDNPAIDLLDVVAYLGVPITAATGEVIGALCVIDHVPRHWTDSDLDVLRRLGKSVDDLLRLNATNTTLDSLRSFLSDERDYLERVIETVPIAVLSISSEGRILTTNAECRRVLGLSEAEIGSRHFDDSRWKVEMLDGTPIPSESLPVAVVLRDGLPIRNFRHAIIWPNGERRILSVNASPLRMRSGTVAVVCAVEDVTDCAD